MALAILAVFLLQGCMWGFIPDQIDPSGGLGRQDYKALRERGDTATPAPPIPELPVVLAPQAAPPSDDIGRKRVSLNVTDSVPLRDVLIELGRKSKANLEIDPRIQGGILFTAHDQPFRDVLQRICRLAGLRATWEGAFVRVELDEPYQQTYPLDYPSLTRRTTSQVTVATNVFDVDVGNGSGGGHSGGDNNSLAKIAGSSDADFWAELEKSLTQVLATSARNPSFLSNASGGVPTPAGNFSLDRQAGLVTVFGSSVQQEAVKTYLQRLQRKASAQVLIEARIVEVTLSDEFKSGINWRTLFSGATNVAESFGTVGAGAPFTTATTAAKGVFTASLEGKDFAGILNLVQTFGTTRVLSSPRLTVLNNQTAMLKVAQNEVYFITSAQFPTSTTTTGATISGTPVFSSTPHTVPVGLVMTVQPSIDSEHSRVTMTLRPTISRVVTTVNDPSIGLNAAASGLTSSVQSAIPVLAVSEMDSVLQLKSGEVAIMGGLMQDSSTNQDQGVPPFDTLPLVGNLAKSRDNEGATSELVILLRATILDEAPPDEADQELYHHYTHDPRPLPFKGTKADSTDDTQTP